MDRHLATTESSHLSSLRRCGVCIMLLATALLLASSAYANITTSIGFQEAGVNSGNITTEATGSGNVAVTGLTYGTFTVNDVSAFDRSILGPLGLLNSQALDLSSSTAGALAIWITTQGLSFTGVQNYVSSFAVNKLSGSIVTVAEHTFFSPTNALFNTGAQTTLNSALFNAIGTAGPFTASGATSGTYSVTHEYAVVDTGGSAGNDNITIDLSATPVPEPASFGLMGIGLAAIAAVSRRRRAIRA